MFIPEYTITSRILRNISAVEHARALIENTVILQNWENQLRKEAEISQIYTNLAFSGITTEKEDIKRYIDELPTDIHPLAKAIHKAYTVFEKSGEMFELDENFIKRIHKEIGTGNQPGRYRKKKLINTTNPEEILADIVEFSDWYHSIDAKETHPLILSGIVKAQLELISPFEEQNFTVANLASKNVLKINGYSAKNLCPIENWYSKTKWDYERVFFGLNQDQEFTEWLEYFTEGLCVEYTNIKERIMLLAKNTKLAKSTGRIKLTARQERIVEYLQDYGLLQNKDFASVFPGTSEDSVLRDLKKLIEMDIVVKTGSTKSSRYEIA